MGIAGQESPEVNGPFRGISLQNLSYCISPTNPSKSLLLRRSSDGRKPGGAYLDDDEAFGGQDSKRYTWVRSPPRLVKNLQDNAAKSGATGAEGVVQRRDAWVDHLYDRAAETKARCNDEWKRQAGRRARKAIDGEPVGRHNLNLKIIQTLLYPNKT